MALPHLSFVVEVIAACLLVVMIVYVTQLNRRLSNLQADKEHLKQLIARFNESTARAEASVGKLRTAAAESSAALQQKVTQASQLRDDLTFLVERAGQSADRLERAIGSSRVEPSPQLSRSEPRKQGDIPAFAPLRKRPSEKAGHTEALHALRGVR